MKTNQFLWLVEQSDDINLSVDASVTSASTALTANINVSLIDSKDTIELWDFTILPRARQVQREDSEMIVAKALLRDIGVVDYEGAGISRPSEVEILLQETKHVKGLEFEILQRRATFEISREGQLIFSMKICVDGSLHANSCGSAEFILVPRQ